MTHRQQFFKLLSGERIGEIPFFPDITDWYKARRTPHGQIQRFPTGAFIPDDHPFHQTNVDMPEEYIDFTLLDFYRHYDWGIPIHIYDWFDLEYDGVDKQVEITEPKCITRFQCKMGTLEKMELIAVDGSLSPHIPLAKTLADLKIIEYIIAHTKVVPRYDRVKTILQSIGEQGVADIVFGRSPFGELVQEYMGFENVVYALADNPGAVISFLDFVTEYDIEVIRMAAGSPPDCHN